MLLRKKKKEFITMFTPIEPHFPVSLKDHTTSTVLITIPTNTHAEDGRNQNITSIKVHLVMSHLETSLKILYLDSSKGLRPVAFL